MAKPTCQDCGKPISKRPAVRCVLCANRAMGLAVRRDPADRFWAFVEKTASCWLWNGAINSRGYSAFRAGNGAGTVSAHRFAYELLVGSIPAGLTLDHLCRVRNCVNPAHLEPITRGENVLRGTGPTACHARKTHCCHGHKFTPENTYTRNNGGRQCRSCLSKRKRTRAHLNA